MDEAVGRIESKRVKLEDNIARLRKSLRYWQTWEAEYDALREEIKSLPDDAGDEDFQNVAQDFGSEVIGLEEIEELAGVRQSLGRSPGQVASMISRRIDYTQQNCRSINRQLQHVEAELEGSDQLADYDHRVADIPSTEIIEVLDEDDKVLSGRLARPGEHADELLNTLNKVGAYPSSKSEGEVKPEAKDSQQDTGRLGGDSSSLHDQVEMGYPVKKKAVSFSEDTKEPKPEALEPRWSISAENQSEHAQATPSEISSKNLMEEDAKVWQLDENDQPVDFHSPYIPTNESPEDAALRREMLKYNMSEVGSVVAELELDDDTDESYFSGDDDEIDLGVLSSDEDEDHEDHFGRSTKSMINDDYLEEMLRLEKKLNAQIIENSGPEEQSNSGQADWKEIPCGLENHHSNQETSHGKSTRQQTAHKSVRFAETLDIAPTELKQPPETLGSEMREQKSENIIGLPSSAPSTEEQEESLPKTSRFKQARGTLRKGHTKTEASSALASDIVERVPKHDSHTHGHGEKKVSRFKASRA